MIRVQKIYQEVDSPKSFFRELEISNIETYERNGKIAGVRSENGRKFRLKTLGFHSEDVAILDKTYRKLKRLKQKREQHNLKQQKTKINEINNERN